MITKNAPDISSEQPVPGFEGPEKTLEIWFKTPKNPLKKYDFERVPFSHQGDASSPLPTNVSVDSDGTWTYAKSWLRSVPVASWQEMLNLVKAQILSSVSNEHCDAYLLRFAPSLVLTPMY